MVIIVAVYKAIIS